MKPIVEMVLERVHPEEMALGAVEGSNDVSQTASVIPGGGTPRRRHFMSVNLVVAPPKVESNVPERAIREQLSRMLDSAIFVHSHRLSRFLRFTVETTLAGQAEILKEYVIGTEVYDRKPPYHPSTDSIVRSEARRLRNKLKQYYESDGKNDAVFIYYRPGGYVPVVRLHRRNRNRIERSRTLGDLLAEGLFAQGLSLPSAVEELDVRIVFEGTVRISHPGSTSYVLTDVRSGSKVAKRGSMRTAV